ncbi:MAG: hypothetical protein OXB98_18820 [Bryobacterales bacterium]|nr:hypothetical protein [Bryobacterales bacterium]
MNPENQAHSSHPAGNRPDPEKKSLSEAAEATNANAPAPQHPPRRRRSLGLLIVMALLLIGVGQAAWPVIDISAVAQLVETVRLAGDTLSEMTTAKDALLGQVAVLTGTWSNLTGAAYELGENASSLATNFSLTQIEAELNTRITNEQNAWPTAVDVQNAYAGEDATVIQQVLDAHQEATTNREAERNTWYDSQIVIAEAGEFLSRIEATASTQNSETTQGLGAQLDRQIAVASSTRDLTARQLELALSAEHRAARLDHQRSLVQAQLRRQGLAIRTEIQDTVADYQADFDSAAFDQTLFTPVLPTN